MTYELPRTESGKVDFVGVQHDMHNNFTVTIEEILKAIDANARAEERNSCALIAEGFQAATNSKAMTSFCEAGVVGDVIERDLAIGRAIRARGDSQ